MLVLNRRQGERIYLEFYDASGKRIRIVVSVAGKFGDKMKIGITAPESVKVSREELIATDDREPEDYP